MFIGSSSFSQIPVGYYNTAAGLTGAPLKLALHYIIDNHNVQSYASLWNHFTSTDAKPNGKVWDIYSDIPNGTPNGIPPYVYTFSADQCGTYAVEGDCYNREHSWPQSWFNSVSGPVSDLFHIYPTDGKVNGVRSNYPYGKVTSATTTSQNGSKLGANVFPGYSGVVFEPLDEYKGDLARSYFYMSTRYQLEDGGWSSSACTNLSTILQWQVNLLLTWNELDPVSAKEIARNNAIYTIQNNRNPYIDNPQWVDSVWTSTLETSDLVTNNSCFGGNTGSIVVTPLMGVAPYSYTWTGSSNTTNTLTGLAIGTYVCTITDGVGAIFTSTTTITQPNTLQGNGVVNNIGGTIALTTNGGTAPYTFLWSNGVTTEDITIPVANGNYTVTITDAAGCSVQVTYTVNSAAGLEEVVSVSSLAIAPNPAQNWFTLSVNERTISAIEVSDVLGKIVYSTTLDALTSVQVDCSTWKAGLYFVKATSGSQQLLTRFVKE